VQFVLIVLMGKEEEEEPKTVSFLEVELHAVRYAGGFAFISNTIFFRAYLLLLLIELLPREIGCRRFVHHSSWMTSSRGR
jgi:hypothetical protein